MILTRKLVASLHGGFVRDPIEVEAISLTNSPGAVSWSISDQVFTISVDGGAPAALPLGGILVSDVVAWILGLGLTAAALQQPDMGAETLLDDSGEVAVSGGVVWTSFTDPTWALLDAFAFELQGIRGSIGNMRADLGLSTASGEWLDFHGAHYGVARTAGESDPDYAARIVATATKTLLTNRTLENAITGAIQATSVVVADAGLLSFPHYLNGYYTLGGVYPIGYLPGGSPAIDATILAPIPQGESEAIVGGRARSVIEFTRAAGVAVRSLSVNGVPA
ncbi:MAG: hypothetical protein COX57_04435 [Alphaproteobacteria bacterium CG_4_10_14_0_2_um_filter_63_37]|nr:MAG: hypothetical protein AUJ55_08060 [Proteobacteria bacterium CG1_02_64_396]PJA25289.1 MAG: hypothetical protein COX57_04435 [Alphaproteobacteria bacterium CG_4_10_14_0_2_um_filter_63_37]